MSTEVLAAKLARRFFAHLTDFTDPHTALQAAVEARKIPIARRLAALTAANNLGTSRVYVP